MPYVRIQLAPIASLGTAERYHQIHMKQCSRFTLSSQTGQDAYTEYCQCGQTRQLHDTQALVNGTLDTETPWSSETDTNLVQTNAYGEIKMAGLMTVRKAKFIRVADTEVEEILALITDEWNLQIPDFIILLLGDLADLDRSIREGISRACTSNQPHVWVIGDGFNSVVLDNVWDKFSHYQVRPVVFGICGWGQVAMKHLLADELGRGKWPASYLHSNPNFGQSINLSHMIRSTEYSLDKTYSHFLLVDNGTIYKEVDLSKFIKEFVGKLQQKCCKIVNILHGGEYSTLNLLRDIMDDGQNPTLVVKNSGRCADIVVNTVEMNKTLGSQKAIQERLVEQFPNLDESSFLFQISLAKYGLCWFVHIYEKGKDLAGQIVNAAFGTMELKDRFDHAIKWRRPDIARDLINAEGRSGAVWVNQIIYQALNTNQPNFLLPILDLDVEISIVLDAFTLQNLYNKVVPKEAPLPTLLNKLRARQQSWCHRSTEDDSPFTLPEVATLIIHLIGKFYKPVYGRMAFKKVQDGVNFQLRSECTRDLLLWAVLNHYPELAFKLWRRVNNPIAAALVATNLLRALAKTIRSSELKRDYLHTALKFELLARDVLDQSYKSEQEQDLMESCTEYLLIKQRETFGFTTCLRLALTGQCQYFIEHASVQALLDKIWLGQIAYENEAWKIMLCILCPIFVNPLIYFRMDTDRRIFLEKGDTIAKSSWKRLSGRRDSQLPSMQSQLDIHKHHSAIVGTCMRRMIHFCRAPLVVFSYNCIMYLIFLILFSYTLMSDFIPNSVSRTEMALSAWVLTLIAEEARQIINERSGYLQHEVNWLDIASISTYILGMGIRWYRLEPARYILCISLTLFYVRVLQIFAVFRKLGPLLVMIVEMLKDLVGFMFFLAVFLIAYGVVWHSILYPNSPFTGLTLYSVLRSAYWPMYGEISTFLEETETGTCVMQNGTFESCTWSQLLAPPLMATYILFVNVLMFNLLIAMFSHRFSQIQPLTKTIWSTLRYTLIREYYGRPPFPPPFIIGCHVAQLILYLFKRILVLLASCTGQKNLGRSIRDYTWVWDREIYVLFNVSDTSELSAWECRNAERMLKSRKKETVSESESNLDGDDCYKDLKVST